MNIDLFAAELDKNKFVNVMFGDYMFDVNLVDGEHGQTVSLYCDGEPEKELVDSLVEIIESSLSVYDTFVETDYMVRDRSLSS